MQTDSVQTKLRTTVTLSTLVKSKKVPINRTAYLTVRLTWEGNIDYIEIKEIEEPILSNLEIVGSSASNKIMETEEGKKAIKEISYILQPISLGMGYIETVAMSYNDKLNGKTYHLKTERVGVEAVSAVPEKGEIRLPWMWMIAGLIIMVAGGIGIYYFFKKKGDTQVEQEIAQIMEEKYLDELKDKVDLKNSDKNEPFTLLTNFFRKYLSEKYGISALEATTDELLNMLSSEKLNEGLVRKSKILFSKADVVKFSGKEATQADLDEAYTTVETILETNLAREKEILKEKEEEGKKSTKGLFSKKRGIKEKLVIKNYK